jgi:stress response protein YsnF
MGAVDAVQRANDNTREMVRLQGEQLSVMWRQIKALEAKVREIRGDP